MLPEVFLAEASRSQQLVQRFLLIRLLTASSRSAKNAKHTSLWKKEFLHFHRHDSAFLSQQPQEEDLSQALHPYSGSHCPDVKKPCPAPSVQIQNKD